MVIGVVDRASPTSYCSNSLHELFSSARLVLKTPLPSLIRQQWSPGKNKVREKWGQISQPAAAPWSQVQPVPRLRVYSQQAHTDTTSPTNTLRHTERSHEHSIDGLTLLPSLSEQRAPQPTRAPPCLPLHSLASLAWSLLVITHPLAHLSAASLVPHSSILLTVTSNSSGRKAIFREKNATSNSESLTRKNYNQILHIPFHGK